MEKKELIRCFICLELPRDVMNEIERVQELIKKRGFFYGKFTEIENLHLTLKFLGELSEERLNEIKKRLSEIKQKEFEVSLGELGIFSEKIIRILWMKLNGKEIWDLQSKVDNEIKDIFPLEERFMSHVTLARIKKVPDKKEFLDYISKIKHKAIKFKVNEFFLKKSELKSDGPVYSTIEKYKLESK